MMRILTNRWLHFGFLAFLLLYLAFGIAPDNETRARLSFIAFDHYIKAKPRASSDLVKIVGIDDISLSKLGQWPWSRKVMAQIVTTLTDMGARVIAFDGVMAEPDRTSPFRYAEDLQKYGVLPDVTEKLPDYDALFAEAIERSGVFVSAFTHGSNTQKPRIARPGGQELFRAHKSVRAHFLDNAASFDRTALFLPQFEAVAAGNGSLMARPEVDGLIRRTGMIFSDGQDLYPSLSLEALRINQGKQAPFIGLARVREEDNLPYGDFKIALGTHTIPVDENGAFFVYFRHFDLEKDYISAHEVLDPALSEQIKSKVQGRILFFGSSAEGLKDLRATPLNPFLPGVEIHANVAEQVLQSSYLFRPSFTAMAESTFILAAGVVMIVLAPFVNVGWIALLCAAFTGLGIYGSWMAFVDEGLMLDPFYPSLSVFIIFVFSVFLTYLRTEAERRQVRNAFGYYISPDFMKELTQNPDRLKLGGEIRDLSVMFTDIRSFTTISEGLTPEALIQLMNDFLTPMSDMVMSHRGTIDKYMGDAMMAFWNAPLNDADHARNACRAALGMQAALDPINARLREVAQEEGKSPVLLQAGIGINSGPCAVGNMGSRQRSAYSALGDAVNLASRLEGQTKGYGVGILVGETTYNQAQDMAMLELDLIQVKGKTKPVRIFALLGDEDKAMGANFLSWRKDHGLMLERYREAQFSGALELCTELQTGQGAELAQYYEMFALRCQDLLTAPPDKDWDGVFVARSK